ncbi:MAG: hypothetical protein LW835_14175, partial [Burkholderiaceae bacterium]|nr:hypothetical protein [Burkholderiaceae bacterium]
HGLRGRGDHRGATAQRKAAQQQKDSQHHDTRPSFEGTEYGGRTQRQPLKETTLAGTTCREQVAAPPCRLIALSPYRRIAVSPYRRLAVSPVALHAGAPGRWLPQRSGAGPPVSSSTKLPP